MITAPYNFVPLNEKVFFPPWAQKISHDIPFSDGESGEIEISITAKSPIFVRDSQDEKKFCNYNGEYYIPGSSIKGMIRNVLEIMSFSKMSFVDDKTYSVRDLKYTTYLDKSKNVSCGWLFYDENGELKIEDCGEPYRIHYDAIGRKFGIDYKTNFLIKQDDLEKKDFKQLYKMLDTKKLSQDLKDEYEDVRKSSDKEQESQFAEKLREFFLTGNFDEANSPYKKAHEKYNLIDEDILNTVYTFSKHTTDKPGRKIVNFEDNGPNRGKLVLTGHPSARKEGENVKTSGKIFDFVFMEQENAKVYTVRKEIFENFKFAYFDGRDTQPTESEDWSFWKEKLNNGGRVPVFFHKNMGGVSSFGLSYLYKFPYEKSILKALIGDHTSDEVDLSESIFGYSKKIANKQEALKGRVNFSHARAMSTANELRQREVLLGSPKASYYPIYIVQNGKEYKTLMDGSSVLAGWKRYPVHKKFSHRGEKSSSQATTITPLDKTSCTQPKVVKSSSQATTITPLDSGVKFRSKIRFHNLNKVEIGALLSAITFHGNKGFKHSIGMAKPYGYGKVELTLENSTLKEDIKEYLKAFESALNAELFNGELKWHISQQMKNLFAMAMEQNDENLSYMQLQEFAKSKNKLDDGSYDYLDRYINLDGVQTPKIDTFSDKEAVQSYLEQIRELKREKELQKEWNIAKSSKNIDRLKRFCEVYSDSVYKEEAQKLIKSIEQEAKNLKMQEYEQKAQQKWEAIHKPDVKKYLQNSLKKFIEEFAESQLATEAQKELENLTQSSQKPATQKLDSLAFLETIDFKGADKKIKQYLSGRKPTEDEVQQIENFVKKHANDLPSSSKKRKRELKEYAKWIDIELYLL